jgi:hypothetical protein
MQKEKYTFDMTLKEWKRLNSESIENAIACIKTTRMCDLFKEEVECDYSYFYEEKKNRSQMSREDVRTHRVYKFIQLYCFYDGSSRDDSDNLGATSYKILDMWEENEKKYNQSMVMHFYYLALVLESIADRWYLYEQYLERMQKRKERGEKKLRIDSFYRFYKKLERQEEE